MAVVSYPAALALHARSRPDETALIVGDERVDWQSLDERSTRLARVLALRGAGPGDFVTLGLPNGADFVVACFAAWKLGAVPQPVSWRMPAAERDAILEQAAPPVVVDEAALPALLEAAGGASAEPLPDATSPSRQALASGGSTGRPKLIVDALPAEIDPTVPFYGNAPGTTVLVPGPLYHAAGFVNTSTTLLLGGTVVLMPRFDPAAALALIEAHRVEWVSFVPTMLQRIWRMDPAERERFDLSSLRRVVSSGGPCPPWLMDALIEWLGPERVWNAYGGTERIGGTLISGSEWLEHRGSVGRPTGDRKIRILDEDGNDLPPGEIGEVYMMPPGGQGSTYRYIGATSRATADGWESLGDLGHVDADGYLYLSDRRTDMIVTGGSNVYPAEVEAALDAHPAVVASAVIGLPDDDLGQRVHAIVQSDDPPGEDALREHLARHLVRYKTPRSFEFTTTPLRDESGKMRRSALRAARLPPERAQRVERP
ncbi:MAG: AMP-binding protein [Myxococcota bacterium]